MKSFHATIPKHVHTHSWYFYLRAHLLVCLLNHMLVTQCRMRLPPLFRAMTIDKNPHYPFHTIHGKRVIRNAEDHWEDRSSAQRWQLLLPWVLPSQDPDGPLTWPICRTIYWWCICRAFRTFNTDWNGWPSLSDPCLWQWPGVLGVAPLLDRCNSQIYANGNWASQHAYTWLVPTWRSGWLMRRWQKQRRWVSGTFLP